MLIQLLCDISDEASTKYPCVCVDVLHVCLTSAAASVGSQWVQKYNKKYILFLGGNNVN